MSSGVTTTIQRVAVIGGGPLGVCVTKYLKAEKFFQSIDVFEQTNTVEGAWNHGVPKQDEYTEVPQTDPFQVLPSPEWRQSDGVESPYFTTPMYDDLETNLPKELMRFSDLAFNAGDQLFPRRECVSRYLRDYASDIKQNIKFETQVIDVELKSCQKDTWTLTSQDLRTGTKQVADYDAIAICSGHYTVPFLPEYPGISRWHSLYPDSIMHSKFYRSNDLFRNKKVVVVGNAASGTDIAGQILKVSKLPIIASQRSKSFLSVAGEQNDIKRRVVPEIARFIDPAEKERAIEFTDGHIETDVDMVLFATGYLYSFPFLRNEQLELISSGLRIEKTYLHLFHREHPSIAFFGMPIRIVPFPIGEAQAAVVARVWSGRLDLPPIAEMIDWEKSVIDEMGNGRHFHLLEYPKDYNYQMSLFQLVSQSRPGNGKLPIHWSKEQVWMRENTSVLKRRFAQRGDIRGEVTACHQLGFGVGF